MKEPWFYEVWLRNKEGGLPWACVHGVAYSKDEAEQLARKRYAHWPETLEAKVRALHEIAFMPEQTRQQKMDELGSPNKT